VFQARYALSPYIKQKRFVFKALIRIIAFLPQLGTSSYLFPWNASSHLNNLIPLEILEEQNRLWILLCNFLQPLFISFLVGLHIFVSCLFSMKFFSDTRVHILHQNKTRKIKAFLFRSLILPKQDTIYRCLSSGGPQVVHQGPAVWPDSSQQNTQVFLFL
jgi:hypothetical protein